VHSHSRVSRGATWSLVAMLTLLLPVSGDAQICLGSPAVPGQSALGAGGSFADGAKGYGVSAAGNLESPVSVGASAAVVNFDNLRKNMTVVGASLAIDLPTEGFGACPITGIGYFSWGDRFEGIDFDVTGIEIPLLIGIGFRAEMDGGNALIPSTTFGLLHTRARISGGLSESDSDSSFYASGGLTLALHQVFFRGGVSKVFVEGSDPSMDVSFGIRF
jgi:hypothetical protein